MALDAARAATRLAVRECFGGDWGAGVLVACSGGADSLALLAACVFEGHKAGVRVVGTVVDHGLQVGSEEHTARVVAQMAELGADETASVRITVDPGGSGIEAAARDARYEVLSQLAEHFGLSVVLGHTLDDQAETVLLGLARGSGGRSLQGMRRSFSVGGPLFFRPFLDRTREQTEAACRADGIEWWSDPHNDDPSFLRSRVRHTVLPVLERELGPGVADALARTGEQLREDMEFIERHELVAYERARLPDGIDLDQVDDVGPAIESRCVRRAAIDAGAIASELTREHVLAVLGLLGSHGERQIQLPGHLTAYADGETLHFRSTAPQFRVVHVRFVVWRRVRPRI